MPRVSTLIQIRQRRRTLEQRRPDRWLGLSFATLLCLALAGLIFSLTLVYLNLTQALPSPERLPALLQPPDGLLIQPTRLLDSTGQHAVAVLQNPAAADRHYLVYRAGEFPCDSCEILPHSLISATIATADPQFWQHAGFSWQGLLEDRHPTLAQILVSELLLADEPAGLRRALRERLLAAQVTAQYGRERVLEWYLNSVNYGRLAFGADAAARVYFGKPAGRLSLAEAILLAAVAEAPGLNPQDAPGLVLERRAGILKAMMEQRLVAPQVAAQAIQENLVFKPPAGTVQDLAPAFTRLALEQAEAQLGRARLERGGLQVITTLNVDLQFQAACAAATALARLDDPALEVQATGRVPCAAARFLPTLEISGTHQAAGWDTGLAVVDPPTGRVLALVGDPLPEADPAHLPGHAPGSMLAPFVYLTAFTQGFGPATLLWDLPAVEPDWDLANFDGRYHGPLRLRVALATGRLPPASRLLAQVGPENVGRILQGLGVTSLNLPAGSQAAHRLQDGSEVTLLEITRAFAALAAGGNLAGRNLEIGAVAPAVNPIQAAVGTTGLQAVTLLRIRDGNGRSLLDWSDTQASPVLTPALAYLITDVLSDASARSANPDLLDLGRPAAGFLGRTADGKNAWAAGYTRQLAVGVWIGKPQNPVPGNPQASTFLAGAVWRAVFQYANRELPSLGWSVPAGISTLTVCDPSGLLPTSSCASTVREVFIAGNEPTQPDNFYRSVQINRENGRLATIFTPANLLEDKIYLDFPPEGQDWALAAGLPLLPKDFDVISVPRNHSNSVNITSPAQFAAVKGQVAILGTAGGKGLASFRIQVGQGLNPRSWVQVGQDVTQAVEKGQLALWDTHGLNGLYSIQLQVVRQDHLLESSVVQVSVDNQPPQVKILYPAQGQLLTMSAGETLTFISQASDDLALQSVAFYLDGKLLVAQDTPPFRVPWTPQLGGHILRVLASDRAGNTAEDQVNFQVK